MLRVVLVDGYVDEPACFGVPPYISPYVRYVAGAIWDTAGNADVRYFTIDFVRENFKLIRKAVESCHLLIIVMGVTVPGKYLGGKPLTIREAIRLFG
ncbi:radical SAM protein, partial [archaeon]